MRFKLLWQLRGSSSRAACDPREYTVIIQTRPACTRLQLSICERSASLIKIRMSRLIWILYIVGRIRHVTQQCFCFHSITQLYIEYNIPSLFSWNSFWYCIVFILIQGLWSNFKIIAFLMFVYSVIAFCADTDLASHLGLHCDCWDIINWKRMHDTHNPEELETWVFIFYVFTLLNELGQRDKKNMSVAAPL